jgi:hypothetical protein
MRLNGKRPGRPVVGQFERGCLMTSEKKIAVVKNIVQEISKNKKDNKTYRADVISIIESAANTILSCESFSFILRLKNALQTKWL